MKSPAPVVVGGVLTVDLHADEPAPDPAWRSWGRYSIARSLLPLLSIVAATLIVSMVLLSFRA